jgi:hypothetical protein
MTRSTTHLPSPPTPNPLSRSLSPSTVYPRPPQLTLLDSNEGRFISAALTSAANVPVALVGFRLIFPKTSNAQPSYRLVGGTRLRQLSRNGNSWYFTFEFPARSGQWEFLEAGFVVGLGTYHP